MGGGRGGVMAEKTEEYESKRKTQCKCEKKSRRSEAPLAFSRHPPPTHSLSGSHSLLFSPTPLVFTPPLLLSCPFFTYLPSPLLLLTPSLVRLLIRTGGTIVPLLPLFGNPGLKQMLFTQAVAQPGPSPSLQQGQV